MSGPTTTRRRATYEDLCEVPDHKVADLTTLWPDPPADAPAI